MADKKVEIKLIIDEKKKEGKTKIQYETDQDKFNTMKEIIKKTKGWNMGDITILITNLSNLVGYAIRVQNPDFNKDFALRFLQKSVKQGFEEGWRMATEKTGGTK